MERRDKTDFIATVTYLTPEQGGRKTPAHTGYRPHFQIEGYDIITSAQQTFIGKDIVMPGETVDAQVILLCPKVFFKRLFVGQSCEFCEGARLVATGKIKAILNSELEISL